MRILLTGASGFIGSHIVNRLSLMGHQIFAVGRTIRQWPQTNIHGVVFDFLQDDPKTLVSTLQCDLCLHFAWLVEHIGLENNQLQSVLHEAYAQSSIRLINEFFKAGGKRFVFAGSCYEYEGISGCCRENMQLNPYSEYAKAKLKVSKYLQEIVAAGQSCLSARIFNVIGAGDLPGRLMGGACDAIVQHRNFTCGVHPQWCFDFIDVDDVAIQISKLAFSSACGIFNVGSGKFINAKSALKQLFARYQSSDKLCFLGKAEDVFQQGMYADMTSTIKTIGKIKCKSIEQSLDESIEYFRQISLPAL